VPVPPAPPAAPAPFVFVEPPVPLEPQFAPLAPIPPEPPTPFVFEPGAFDVNELEFALRDLPDLSDLNLQVRAAQRAAEKLASKAAQFPQPAPGKLPSRPFERSRDEGLYDQARSMIERNQYERALSVLDQVIENKGARAEAAMYWKAYTLSKLTRRNDALTVLSDLQKQFPNGPWTRDARALEVEVRQASGQSVSTSGVDDDTKVLALRGLMQSDPESTLPTIEKLLAGNSSVRVKDRALFLLSQSRAARARDLLAGVAKNGSNPDLRMAAVRYLGMRSDPESQQILTDVYGSTNDLDMKRSILRSLMTANARDRLLTIAKSERSAELRAVAVQQLGAVRGSTELEELYRTESDRDVKQRILQSMIAANATEKLARIARDEKDPELQRMAIRNLGATNQPVAAEALRAIYMSDAPIETKKAVIQGLSIHQNCSVLVALAKAERNTELRNEIVNRLATQTNRCAEARDYMLEILNGR
jgi:hypothetical protein